MAARPSVVLVLLAALSSLGAFPTARKTSSSKRRLRPWPSKSASMPNTIAARKRCNWLGQEMPP